MKSLTYSLILNAIAINMAAGLIETSLAQNNSFIYNDITYTVNLKENTAKKLAFTMSHADSSGNTHTVEYQGICGGETIGVLGETVVNPEGKVVSNNTAVQAITFNINSSDWEVSGAIREALKMMCQ